MVRDEQHRTQSTPNHHQPNSFYFHTAVPESVSDGFLLAFPLILSVSQMNWCFGLTKQPPTTHFLTGVYHSLVNLGEANWWSVGWSVLNVVTFYKLGSKWPRVPWLVVHYSIGCLIGFLSDQQLLGPIRLPIIGDRFSTEFPLVLWPPFEASSFSMDTFWTSVSVALLILMEDQLSCRIAERMTGKEYSSRAEAFGIAMSSKCVCVCVSFSFLFFSFHLFSYLVFFIHLLSYRSCICFRRWSSGDGGCHARHL
jgi:MFS superfamily sulfate permease-like transporter